MATVRATALRFALTKGSCSKRQLWNSLRWPIYAINSVDNTQLPCYTLPPTQHHSFFGNLPPWELSVKNVCIDHLNTEVRDEKTYAAYTFLLNLIWLIFQRWKNEFLVWDSKAFGDVERVQFLPSEIWVPDISLYNKWVMASLCNKIRETKKLWININQHVINLRKRCYSQNSIFATIAVFNKMSASMFKISLKYSGEIFKSYLYSNILT